MEESPKILLADSDEFFCNMLAESLSEEGYFCNLATTPQNLLIQVSLGIYDLLILDTEFPGNADLQLVREVTSTAPGLQIILTATNPSLETAMEAVHLPVTAYLPKPLDMNQLYHHLRRAITRSRLYRTVIDTQTRLAHWQETIAKITSLLKEPQEGSDSKLMAPLVATTFENVIESVIELRRVIDILSTKGSTSRASELASLLKKMDLTRAALHETIRILEETKHAFKSKRLGELRRQLQVLLVILEKDDSQLARQRPGKQRLSEQSTLQLPEEDHT